MRSEVNYKNKKGYVDIVYIDDQKIKIEGECRDEMSKVWRRK